MKRFKLLNTQQLFVSVLLFLSITTNAQNNLTLENVLAITLKENIDIKIKTNELNQVENYEKVGVLGVLPRIKINGSSSINNGTSSLEFAADDFPSINDASSESTSINGNIEFSYNLFNGLGSIYTYQKLKKQSDLKSTELLIQIEQALIKTAKQYYDIAYLQEQNKIYSDLLDVSKERYERVKIQNEFGNASKLDLLSAEIDLNKDSVNLINSNYDLKVAKNQLNQTLNRELTLDFNVDNKVEINSNLLYSDLNKEIQKNNNNILFQQYLIEVSKKDKKINSSSIFPQVNISTQYGYNNTESNTSLILDQTSLGLTGYINFTWDIFDGLARGKINQNKKIEIESNKLQLIAIEQEIQKEFNSTYQLYSNSINLIDIERRNQSTSEKFFERAKEQFYQGQLSRNDFRLAQIDLSMSKNRLNQTLYTAKIAELNLYRLSGKILEKASY
ncbi:TolC family protein [bacterium]|nr:TolC family protein [bacterium]